MSTTKTTTLDNGLRIITDHIESVESIALGFWVNVGTRNEDLKDNGVAHMVEHMLFKGTKTRDAAAIVKDVEDVGGSMNAYTSRELTSYHVHLLKDDAELALDVLGDMYTNSIFSEEEIKRERDVILQEIGMCNDTPDDLIFDLYFETAYPKQSFGAPILGRAHNIEAMSRETLTNHVTQSYTPERTVISAAGNLDHDALVEQAKNFDFSQTESKNQNAKAAAYKGGDMRLEKDLEQSHIILGFQGISRLDPDYYATQALSAILGSGMSSRLFQEVREKRGLVYSIFSFHSAFQDDGQFGIYAGTGPERLNETLPVICDEILKLQHDISEEELARTKTQLKAGLLMGRESMMSRADQQAKYALFREKPFDLENLVQQIEAIDLKTIKKIAERIFSRTPTIAALGPLDQLESYDKIQARLAA